MPNTKKYKNDNNKIKKFSRQKLIDKMVQIGTKHLTATEGEVLFQTLVNNKSFSEIADNRQLTFGRVKQIYNNSFARLLSYFDLLDERLIKFKEIAGQYAQMEERLSHYEKQEATKKLERNIFESLPVGTQKLLQMKIVETDLPARMKSVCLYAKINTLAELVQYTPKKILRFRNCGKKSITETEEFFSDNGLKWGMLEMTR